MKHLPVSLMLLLAATLAASPAHADDCGESDRVPLPRCVAVSRIRGTNPGVRVHNNCSYPITVKFDKSGGDMRSDIPSGQRHEVAAPEDTDVLCCPRYNRCGADWIRVATPANVTFKQISVGSAQHVWTVDTQGSPWRWTGTTWEKKTGTVASLSVAADGVVWGLQSSGQIWVYQGPDWASRPGTLQNISAASGNVVWGVQSSGATFRWDP